MTRALTEAELIAELEERHKRLQRLKVQVETEIVTVQERLRNLGAWGRAGRPRKAPTHTYEEALECHRRYQAGERTPWIIAGRNQYNRERRRAERALEGT